MNEIQANPLVDNQREPNQSIATRLYDAALVGDVPSLLNLLREDPLLLHRCTIEKTGQFNQSQLHVAAKFGHLAFTKEILLRKPELAEELDSSRRSSALHMAALKGHLEIVRALLAVSPDMCLVRDLEGRNPVHVAAMRGLIQVVDELVRARPQAALERTYGGDTVLHLCVRYSQLEALKFLVYAVNDGQLLNSRDAGGNSVLHLAVAAKELEMVRFLLKDKRIDKNAINTNGLTAMDTCIQGGKDVRDVAIWRSLRRAKALQAKEALKPRNIHRSWLEKQRNALMVVASLIATMAFQAGVNPPGGVWQDDNGHKVGTAIMASAKTGQHDIQYDVFFISNTVGLVSSLSVIFMLVSGLPCKKLFVGLLMATMWLALTATTVTYLVSVNFLASSKQDHKSLIPGINNYLILISSNDHHPVQQAVLYSLFAWLFLMILLLIGHAIRLVIKLIKKLVRLVIKVCRWGKPRSRS